MAGQLTFHDARNPDVEHIFGPGASGYREGLRRVECQPTVVRPSDRNVSARPRQVIRSDE